MKHIFIAALLLLVVSGTAWSQPEPDDDQAKPKEEVQQAQPPAKKAEEKTQKPGKQEWPTPFVPSEQVGADSVISLPTDI